MQYTVFFRAIKIGNFQLKNCDIFLFFAHNINCGYLLEPPLTGTHNQCFRAKIRKIMYTPVNPSFAI